METRFHCFSQANDAQLFYMCLMFDTENDDVCYHGSFVLLFNSLLEWIRRSESILTSTHSQTLLCIALWSYGATV